MYWQDWKNEKTANALMKMLLRGVVPKIYIYNNYGKKVCSISVNTQRLCVGGGKNDVTGRYDSQLAINYKYN